MADRNLEAYCGLYCGACPVYLKQFDNWLVQAIMEWADCEVSDLDCLGCRSETLSLSCRDCDRRDCAQSKSFDSCSVCPEMPCDRMRSYRLPHMSEAVPNLKALRDRGTAAWLGEQVDHWRCPSCGKAGSWYEQVCLECGSVLPSGHSRPNDL